MILHNHHYVQFSLQAGVECLQQLTHSKHNIRQLSIHGNFCQRFHFIHRPLLSPPIIWDRIFPPKHLYCSINYRPSRDNFTLTTNCEQPHKNIHAFVETRWSMWSLLWSLLNLISGLWVLLKNGLLLQIHLQLTCLSIRFILTGPKLDQMLSHFCPFRIRPWTMLIDLQKFQFTFMMVLSILWKILVG